MTRVLFPMVPTARRDVSPGPLFDARWRRWYQTRLLLTTHPLTFETKLGQEGPEKRAAMALPDHVREAVMVTTRAVPDKARPDV